MPMSTNAASSGPIGLSLKAWGRVTGAGALISGWNVASVVRAGTGTYNITFTNAMASTTYIIKYIGLNAGVSYLAVPGVYAKTAASFQAYLAQYGGAMLDQDFHFEVYE